MAQSLPRLIYRGKGEINNVPDNFHWFDCLREAHHAYPTAEEWDRAYWEQVSCWGHKPGDEPPTELRSIIEEVDQTFCVIAAEHEEWWQWLEGQKAVFPDASIVIYRGAVDSRYTSIIFDDDRLTMMFKQAFQGT